MRRTPLLVTLPLAGAALLAGCGSSAATNAQGPTSTAASTSTSTAASASAPATAGPSVAAPTSVPAAAVPKVTGQLGYEPKVAADTAAPPSSLLVHDIVVGDGETAEPGDQLQVQYTGSFFATGKDFDASWTDGTGSNFTFVLDDSPAQVIAGWDQGLVGMKVGGRRELVIPPSLAYGSQAYDGIPANSTLVFVIDLRSAVAPQ